MQPSAGVKRARSQDEQKEGYTSMSFDATSSSGARETQRPRWHEQSDRDAQMQPQDHSASPPAAAAATCMALSSTVAHSSPPSQEAAQADGQIETVGASAAGAGDQPEAKQLRPIQLPGAAAQQSSAIAASRLQLLRLSPGQCCDQDSLSVLLSFLGTADFLAAIRVCRQWHATRLKHSAWPKLHLPSFVQSLRDDDYNNPDRRRLNVAIKARGISGLVALLGAAIVAPAGSAAPPTGSMWRHVTDVKLRVPDEVFSFGPKKQTAWESSLQQLAQLPNLSVLNLQGCTADSAAVAAFYSAVCSRLQALLLSDCSSALLSHLPLLSNLRVLVLDKAPAWTAVAPLHRLEYLHFNVSRLDAPISSHLEVVLRWLSSSQSLRSLSVTSVDVKVYDFALLFHPAKTAEELAQLAISDANAASSTNIPLPRLDWAKPCGLTDVSMVGTLSTALISAICALPQLTRLQCESQPLLRGPAPPLEALALLPQLRLKWHDNPGGDECMVMQLGWSHLLRCSQLRVLELSLTSARADGPLTLTVPAAELQRVLATCTATLQELRVDSSFRIDYRATRSAAADASPPQAHSEVPNGWGVLARCTQLRVLKIALQPDVESSGMLEALSLLPAFQALELDLAGSVHHGWGTRSFKLPSDLLLCFRHSPSWCSLHLHWPRNYIYGDLLRGFGGLPTQLPPELASDAVAKRLRVCDHMPESAVVRSYAIRTDEHGVKNWQQV